MPSFLTNTFASFFNRIIQLNQTGNTGVDATTRNLQTGDGVNTSVSGDLVGMPHGSKISLVKENDPAEKVGSSLVSRGVVVK